MIVYWFDEWTPWKGGEQVRISRDEMFMKIAHVVAERGTCPRAKVGAVLVTRENNIVSIGYNGAPKGEPHCDEVGCKMEGGHCKRSLHAEENTIRNQYIIGAGPYKLYVTHKPCEICTRGIINHGTVESVIFDVPYRYNGPSEWEEGGVKFEQYDPIHS